MEHFSLTGGGLRLATVPDVSQQCTDCVLNLPLDERQCLVQAKQGVYTIKSHDIQDKKHQCVCFFLKGLRGSFPCWGENKTSCLYTGDPCEGCAEFAPPPPPPPPRHRTKNPRYGPEFSIAIYLLDGLKSAWPSHVLQGFSFSSIGLSRSSIIWVEN